MRTRTQLSFHKYHNPKLIFPKILVIIFISKPESCYYCLRTLARLFLDHDQAELVSLSICQFESNTVDSDSFENGNSSKILVTETFTFTSDSSQFLAQQLLTNALDVSGLKHLETVYSSLLNVSLADKRALDTKLAASFRNISRTTTWLLADSERTSKYNFNSVTTRAQVSAIKYVKYDPRT